MVEAVGTAIVDVLIGVLDDLRDPSMIPLTPAASRTALSICEQLSARLRVLVNMEGDAEDSSSMASVKSLTDGTNSLSIGSDELEQEPAGSTDDDQSTHRSASRNRLSKRSRERRRRQQLCQDQIQDGRNGINTHERACHLRWNSGWQMIPAPSHPSYSEMVSGSAESEALFIHSMWTGQWSSPNCPVHGGWAMVPAGSIEPNQLVPIRIDAGLDYVSAWTGSNPLQEQTDCMSPQPGQELRQGSAETLARRGDNISTGSSTSEASNLSESNTELASGSNAANSGSGGDGASLMSSASAFGAADRSKLTHTSNRSAGIASDADCGLDSYEDSSEA